MKRRRQTYDRDLEDCEVEDGGIVRVPMTLMDSANVAALRDRYASPLMSLTDAELGERRLIRDALIKHQPLAATHRPGYCADRLKWATFDDALSIGLQDAIERRQAIFDEESKRRDNLWRGGPALADQAPDESNEPEPDGNDDSDDDHDDNYALEQAMADREAARIERDRLGDEKWRTAGVTDPTAALAIQRQAAAWRHGR